MQKVELLGGELQIEWRKEDNHVYMTGPAVTVFEGELYEEDIIYKIKVLIYNKKKS